MKSTAPLSRAESEHEDVNSRRHQIDKRRNEGWRDKEFCIEEVPSHREKPPGLTGPWSISRRGTAYKFIGPVMLEADTRELFKMREEYRTKFPRYRGYMTRTTKAGAVRQARVMRELKKPVAGFRFTLPPWRLRLLKDVPEEERRKVLRRAYEAGGHVLQRAGWNLIGVDVHEDTSQVHGTFHVLRINEQNLNLVDLPCASKWTICTERLKRAGIEHPDPVKRGWFEQNMKRHGVTPDIMAHRAMDAVLDDWAKSRNVPALEKQYLDEYVSWQRQWQAKRKARLAVKLLREVEHLVKQTLVTAAMLKVAGMLKEQQQEKQREQRELEKIIEQANSIC